MLSFINFWKIIVCQFSLAYACSWGSSASRFFRQPNFFCPPTLNQKVSHPEPPSYFVHVSKNVIIFFALTSNMIKSCVLWRKIDWNFWGLFWSSGWGFLHWIFSASKISDVRRSWWKISPLPLLHDSPFQPISFWHRSSYSPPPPWLVTWLNILTSNLAPWNETKVYL